MSKLSCIRRPELKSVRGKDEICELRIGQSLRMSKLSCIRRSELKSVRGKEDILYFRKFTLIRKFTQRPSNFQYTNVILPSHTL